MGEKTIKWEDEMCCVKTITSFLFSQEIQPMLGTFSFRTDSSPENMIIRIRASG